MGQLTSALLIVSFIFLMKIMKGQIIPRSHRRSSTSSFIMNSKACLLVFGFLLVFVILACAGEENNDNSLSEEIESTPSFILHSYSRYQDRSTLHRLLILLQATVYSILYQQALLSVNHQRCPRSYPCWQSISVKQFSKCII